MPKYVNGKREVLKVHTVACYPDTWNLFNGFKHKKHLTAEQALNLLTKSYLEKDSTKKLAIYEKLRDQLQNKIDEIRG